MTTPGDQSSSPGSPRHGKWQATPGPELLEFVDRALSGQRDQQEYLIQSSVEILSRGIHPATPGAATRTGLVVGYVQSGKTLSFEAVSALARDNGYQLIILIAGRNNLLLRQSITRFRFDLQIDNIDRPRRWLQLTNPKRAQSSQLFQALDTWRDADAPEYLKRTVICCVLKHQLHVASVTDLIEGYFRTRASAVTTLNVLVIDDEADQASLDIAPDDDDASAVFATILRLRHVLPRHTYLQYTATPQAPLLVSRGSALSPDYAYILKPGTDYIGSLQLFSAHSRQFEVIRAQDVAEDNDTSLQISERLREALRTFIIGVSAGLQEGKNSGSRSMLVHPAMLTEVHQQYTASIDALLDEWRSTFTTDESSARRRVLRTQFESTYKVMCDACAPETLMPFEKIWSGILWALQQIQVLEVNSREGATPEVEWLNFYAWILVGGEVMSRGFTVEGLTVTYLARSLGLGLADTVQQRARFLGYRRDYLKYCRIFVTEDTLRAFLAYVEHEEHFRRELYNLQEAGIPLDEWPRRFVLDRALEPCRRAVLSGNLGRISFAERWISPNSISTEVTENDELRTHWEDIIAGFEWVPDGGHPERSEFHQHNLATQIPLRTVIDWLLTDGAIRPYKEFLLLAAQLGQLLEESPQLQCTVYHMSQGRERERGVSDAGTISQLFQGAYPVEEDVRGSIYPGDRAICSPDQISLQIHYVFPIGEGAMYASGLVPVPAVRIPEGLGQDWIFESTQDLT